MVTLYIANKNYSSWSLRPWLLLRQLGIPFREVLLPFGDEPTWAPFRALNPSGKVPCLIDGGALIWDSMGITEHLADRHPGVWPDDPERRSWARCAAAEMHAGFAQLRSTCSMSVGVRVALHARPPALERDLARLGALWREGLDRFGGPFLAGPEFTAVDAFYAPVAFRMLTYSLSLSPESDAYASRLRALPAMVDWYQAGLAETFRDAAHEDDLPLAGVLVADLRAT